MTAVFDIGKTNKKFFVLDGELQPVYQAYEHFPETTDEDGFPCDDLEAITDWMTTTVTEAIHDRGLPIDRLNFSTYGASFVHLDANGEPVTPLYNYLKPLPVGMEDTFYEEYGDRAKFARETASPTLGMLNSGLQLFWLQHRKPEVFGRIRHSLHLPQYCSYVFTGRITSEYTSIGCHTALWDFDHGRYHNWLHQQELLPLLAPAAPADETVTVKVAGREIAVGPGIHDSSAALHTYLRRFREPFLLLSTGTWAIALNPFNPEPLTEDELAHDCLTFLTVEGTPVKAARLFLGNEYQSQCDRLAAYYGKGTDYHKTVAVDAVELSKVRTRNSRFFRWESLDNTDSPLSTSIAGFATYGAAYHQLMSELVDLQVAQLRRAAGGSGVRRVYVDGGFVDNQLFLYYLRERMPAFTFRPTSAPLGSAQGAALAIL